jgi:opacity protein-like surface antigen
MRPDRFELSLFCKEHVVICNVASGAASILRNAGAGDSSLGIELQYTDFGSLSAGLANKGLGGLSKVDAKATTLSALGYLPLPVPFLDVYGKLGVARLHETTTEVSPFPFCPAVAGSSCVPSSSNLSDWSTNFAYGAGVQGKIGDLAIRAEYERISASGENPSIASLGVTWTF